MAKVKFKCNGRVGILDGHVYGGENVIFICVQGVSTELIGTYENNDRVKEIIEQYCEWERKKYIYETCGLYDSKVGFTNAFNYGQRTSTGSKYAYFELPEE